MKADRIGGLSDGDDLQSRQDVVRQVTWPKNLTHAKSSPSRSCSGSITATNDLLIANQIPLTNLIRHFRDA